MMKRLFLLGASAILMFSQGAFAMSGKRATQLEVDQFAQKRIVCRSPLHGEMVRVSFSWLELPSDDQAQGKAYVLNDTTIDDSHGIIPFFLFRSPRASTDSMTVNDDGSILVTSSESWHLAQFQVNLKSGKGFTREKARFGGGTRSQPVSKRDERRELSGCESD